jgi:hypothetical protein
MRKLKLDVENVTVESFAPQSAGGERGGTVHAHNHTHGGHQTCQFSCAAGCTYDDSCYNPCVTDVC